ncbi:MBOAT family protein [Histomonas meleagridis]|uniref:MBOAT family protein n=1 Tax=Histomonas meleagridis TaxID=135588 RepID=UPI00355A9CF7|nr:MBOAT family protein [Histomonas meleagridis]KAH0799908.1 MBOAT family protein [Histomonas meleagridis]
MGSPLLNTIASLIQTFGPMLIIIVFNVLLYPISRYILPKLSRKQNLWFHVILGLALAIAMFGIEFFIPLIMAVSTYFMLELNPLITIIYSFVFSSASNVYCMVTIAKGWKWMVNSMTLIMFQKIMTTALDLYHGRKLKKGEKIRPFHERVALDKKMSLVEWISYTFTPYGATSGPNFNYKIHEYILETGTRPHVSDDSISHKYAKKRFIMIPVWVILTIVAMKITPISFYSKPFYVNSPAIIRLLLTIFCTFFHTIRYFVAWQSVEAGIYETGAGESGLCEIDDISNLNIFEVLTSDTIAIWLQRWNHSAHIFWKRYLLYPLLDHGCPYWLANPMVLGVSAMWHGFNPVYYLLLPEMIAAQKADLLIHQMFGDVANVGPIVVRLIYRFWIWMSMFNATSTWWYRTFDSFFFVRRSNGYLGTILTFGTYGVMLILSLIIKKPQKKNNEDKKDEDKKKIETKPKSE